MIDFVKHFPSNGQSAFTRQLHNLGFSMLGLGVNKQVFVVHIYSLFDVAHAAVANF